MDFNKIVKEEIDKIVAAADKNSPKIEKELEALRKKFVPEIKELNDGQAVVGRETCKRVELNTVSRIIDVPMSDLMLYFLNCIKNDPDHTKKHFVEYHLGCVYFYKKDSE